MAFVRYKTVKGKRYFQLVRNYRDNGKHRQEVLEHLGPHNSLEEAILAEKQKTDPILKAEAYWRDRAESALQNAKRYYYLHGQGVEVLDVSEAYSRSQELDKLYKAALRSGDPTKAYDRAYGSREAEMSLIRWSIDYHDAIDNAAYYEELYEERRVRLDRLLDLMDKYPQPIRNLETLDLLQGWREKYT
jgi:hypothetical protein